MSPKRYLLYRQIYCFDAQRVLAPHQPIPYLGYLIREGRGSKHKARKKEKIIKNTQTVSEAGTEEVTGHMFLWNILHLNWEGGCVTNERGYI